MSFCKIRKIRGLSGAGDELQGAQAPPRRALAPGRVGRPPGHPGLCLRPHFGSLPSFCCRNFCYIFARIVPATYLAISRVFSSICFYQGKKLLLEMSSCGSSGEDFMGRLLREVQKDLNQGKYIDWATEEEIAARRAEMERSVRKKVKIITAQQPGGPSTQGGRSSNPIMVGSVQPYYDLLLTFQEWPLHLRINVR